jgi:hypothetical protein
MKSNRKLSIGISIPFISIGIFFIFTNFISTVNYLNTPKGFCGLESNQNWYSNFPLLKKGDKISINVQSFTDGESFLIYIGKYTDTLSNDFNNGVNLFYISENDLTKLNITYITPEEGNWIVYIIHNVLMGGRIRLYYDIYKIDPFYQLYIIGLIGDIIIGTSVLLLLRKRFQQK